MGRIVKKKGSGKFLGKEGVTSRAGEGTRRRNDERLDEDTVN